MWQWIITAVLVTEVATRLALIVHVIMRRRPVPVTLAWIVLLVAMPVAGIALYALVGENRLGSRRARRYAELSKEIEERAVGIWRSRFTDWTEAEAAQRRLAALGTRVAGLPPLKGNQLELIGDTGAFLDGLRAEIDAATHHCHLLYYIWTLDPGATAIGEALIRAAARGVACRVLVDGVGGREFLQSPLAEQMAKAGVRVVEALPVRTWRLLLARVDLRNHRKIAVIDGRVAFAGSHNLTAAHYPRTLTRRGGTWVDATLKIRGPAVKALQTVFLSDWFLDSEESPAALESLLATAPGDTAPAEAAEGDCVVHVIPSGPGPEPAAIHQAFLAALHSAHEEIVMTTPYFVPDEATKSALEIAARRGVPVTIVLPEQSDAPLVGAAARSHYEDLLLAGVKIMHYTKGLLHSKTITIDRKVGIITSVNFDMRSFFLNFECSMFIYDDDFASVLRFLQTSYMRNATEIDLEEWQARPGHQRFLQNVAQLFGPLL